MGFIDRLRAGLAKTRGALVERLQAVTARLRRIDETLFEELEAVLLQADVGVETTEALIEHLRRVARERRLEDPSRLIGALKERVRELLGEPVPMAENPDGPTVILVVGVNGAGKTTTIGKLAGYYRRQGKKVLLGAADTFRAAAIDQLVVWGQRAGADVIRQSEGSDPAAVAYDTVQAAKSRQADVVLIDTAGRLQNKANLMEELRKIRRVVGQQLPGAPHEVLLVLDATTGQNALQQARLFTEVAGVTGVALTKLDGTARGGVVVAIRREVGLPVKWVGVGEGMEDLQPFDPDAFVDALFETRETAP
ncbi:signal recognition particle-docking protein FtsY [Caldinitratiruptor microaerophilus]|uniref:Signal recognition particle receptor FtsY n=1 Tax=Caldinitratiruptor microaerophilus TaxID=671077 RepID=A0AA35G810_9FIRM|nr:signal recognition particle-docking protein FtsY [Caldinitratiruptor microaerophilus]